MVGAGRALDALQSLWPCRSILPSFKPFIGSRASMISDPYEGISVSDISCVIAVKISAFSSLEVEKRSLGMV